VSRRARALSCLMGLLIAAPFMMGQEGGCYGPGFSPALLLNYPSVGSSRTMFRDGEPNIDSEGSIEDKYLLLLDANAAGVVRNIWFGLDSSWANPAMEWSDLETWRLRVYTDCGTVNDLNSPPAECLDIDIPFAALVYSYYSPEPNITRTVETDYLEAMYLSYDLPNESKATGVVVSFKYPIPFSNGILVQIGRLDQSIWVPYGSPNETLYSWASYEEGNLPSDPGDRFRLKTGRWDGTTSDPNGARFLDEPNGMGSAAFLWFSSSSLDADALENNWTFRPDGSEETLWQTSGAEDFFGIHNVYYFLLGAYQDRQAGCVYRSESDDPNLPNTGVEAYRTFNTDPVVWSNGCTGFLPNIYSDTLSGHITFLYYQEE